MTKTITPAMQRVLDIARRDGIVISGKGCHNGHVESVNARVIDALIARGLLVQAHGADGNYAGRIPE